ncbi:hypothetical protein M8J77_012437 [Diaphorina citri]|nr:hypothetical protein M8J77_003828 [Diaphorina citri]KAI5715218.1 hypothetical protein M8J77_012437 [Diaphorina citri]
MGQLNARLPFGKVVEIDEAKFGRRKYNRGRVIDGKWLFEEIRRTGDKENITHSYLFTRSDPPSCQCGLPLTIRHLLECRSYIDPSRPAFHRIPSLDDDRDSVENLLGFPRYINVYNLI